MSASRSILTWCLILAFVVIVTPAAASADQEGSGSSVTRRHILSTNPILDMFTWYNAEYELRVSPNSTVGAAGSYVTLNDDDDTYTSFAGFYRYYPQNDALSGFFFGGRIGFHNVKVEGDADEEDESGTFYGFGIDIGYSWLLGETERVALSLGIGAVRLFGGDLEDVTTTLPTIRLVNVGIAF